SATAVTTSGPLGTLTVGQLQGMLSLTASSLTALPADPTNTSNLTWTFNSGGATTFDYLAAGQSLGLTYTVTATHSRSTPASDTQATTITLPGTNDAPNICVGPADRAAATLAETNAILSTSGTPTVTDAPFLHDALPSSSATAVTTSGPLGTLTVGQL